MAPINPGITNLIAWWTLNETSGNRADSHTGEHTAADNNTVTYDTGKISNAAKFTRTNSEYLLVTDHDDFDVTGAFSIGCWVKSSAAAANSDTAIFTKGDGAAYGIHFAGTAGANDHKIYFVINAGIRATGTTVFNDNTWHFIIVVYNLTTAKIYVDNSEDGTGNYSSAVTATADNLTVGKRAAQYYDGLCDELFMYSKALDADERTWLYNSGDGRTYTDVNPPPSTFIPKVIMF